MTDKLNGLHGIRMGLGELSCQLYDIASSLGRVGNEKLAQEIEEIADDVREYKQLVGDIHGDLIGSMAAAADQATTNMVKAAIATQQKDSPDAEPYLE